MLRCHSNHREPMDTDLPIRCNLILKTPLRQKLKYRVIPTIPRRVRSTASLRVTCTWQCANATRARHTCRWTPGAHVAARRE
jgi:hypothetical protein